ncbi:Fic family protein [Striga asiatica]|uniref:Fic family protein n=1 Tax=Striga asiatica TaxID=4170 RepID=A0A5A7R335_STRAF|nr:Fic family protein [Striga asiatica]
MQPDKEDGGKVNSSGCQSHSKRFASSTKPVASTEQTKYTPRGQETKILINVLSRQSLQLSAKMEHPVTAHEDLYSSRKKNPMADKTAFLKMKKNLTAESQQTEMI